MGLECVVNVSEGRDLEVVDRLAAACGQSLLDVHSDPDHNRTVLTLAGTERDGREQCPHARRRRRVGARLRFALRAAPDVRGGRRGAFRSAGAGRADPPRPVSRCRPAELVPAPAGRRTATRPRRRCPRPVRTVGRFRTGTSLLPLRAPAADRAPHPSPGPPHRLHDTRPGHRAGAAAPPRRWLRRGRPALPGGLQPVGGRGATSPWPVRWPRPSGARPSGPSASSCGTRSRCRATWSIPSPSARPSCTTRRPGSWRLVAHRSSGASWSGCCRPPCWPRCPVPAGPNWTCGPRRRSRASWRTRRDQLALTIARPGAAWRGPGAGGGAPARSCRPRCRTSRRWPGRTRGSPRGPRSPGTPPWPHGWRRLAQERTGQGPRPCSWPEPANCVPGDRKAATRGPPVRLPSPLCGNDVTTTVSSSTIVSGSARGRKQVHACTRAAAAGGSPMGAPSPPRQVQRAALSRRGAAPGGAGGSRPGRSRRARRGWCRRCGPR